MADQPLSVFRRDQSRFRGREDARAAHENDVPQEYDMYSGRPTALLLALKAHDRRRDLRLDGRYRSLVHVALPGSHRCDPPFESPICVSISFFSDRSHPGQIPLKREAEDRARFPGGSPLGMWLAIFGLPCNRPAPLSWALPFTVATDAAMQLFESGPLYGFYAVRISPSSSAAARHCSTDLDPAGAGTSP